MAENISFRSSMNGFNRNDVMTYIDSLIAEKAALEVKVANSEKAAEEIKAKAEEEINKYKNTALDSAVGNEAAIARLTAELAQNEAENELLKEKENQYLAEISVLKAKVSELEDEVTAANNQDSKCADCDIAKVYEARLGAAMLDAKRFSEILVKEANDKASDLFADAFSSAHATSVKAGAIAQSITDISNQFNVSFKVLLDNMKALGNTLDSFKHDVKITGEKFDFTTDFATFTGEKSSVAESDKTPETPVTEDIIPALKSNVNFDDADEFDFRVDVND